jgi:hypothetical protein
MQARFVVCALMFLSSITATAQNQTPSDKTALREQSLKRSAVVRKSEAAQT